MEYFLSTRRRASQREFLRSNAGNGENVYYQKTISGQWEGHYEILSVDGNRKDPCATLIPNSTTDATNPTPNANDDANMFSNEAKHH